MREGGGEGRREGEGEVRGIIFTGTKVALHGLHILAEVRLTGGLIELDGGEASTSGGQVHLLKGADQDEMSLRS